MRREGSFDVRLDLILERAVAKLTEVGGSNQDRLLRICAEVASKDDLSDHLVLVLALWVHINGMLMNQLGPDVLRIMVEGVGFQDSKRTDA